MGFTEILTIIFVLLKVFKFVDWSWWIVVLPELIMGSIYILFTILYMLGVRKANKHFDDMWNKF
ncbi:hypothetical protein P261_02259 [Lachnospiraceae bacterium TWA4]|nr:hypothetical protein P261_02259 [Lachnospiraceae bacterium TWA4]